MKKISNIVELVIVIITLLACIQSYQFKQRADELFLIFGMLLACFYFFVSAFHFRKDGKNENSTRFLISLVLTGLALTETLIGILFKLNGWPSADLMLMVGLTGLVIAIGVYGFFYYKTKSTSYLKILSRVVIVFSIGIFLHSLSRMQIVHHKYKDYPDYIEAVRNIQTDGQNPEYIKKVQEERQKIEALKK